MKIGYLLQVEEQVRRPPFNGPANHIRQVVLELGRLGHSVCLLCRLEGKIWKSSNLKDFEPVMVKKIDQGFLRLLERLVRRLQHELKLPYAAFFESLRFALACQQELDGCDIFLERTSWMAYGGALAAAWDKVPLVLEYNGDPLADLEAKGIAPAGLQRRIALSVFKRNLHAAALVVASGEGWRASCIERYGLDPRKVVTIENGTEVVKLLSREDLRSFGAKEEPGRMVTLVYLGGFYPWHGVTQLLCAFASVISQGLDARLVLIGSGSNEEEAKALASELGIRERVCFMGQLTPAEYAPLLAGADLAVSPYCGWAEFSGLKIFDYKAAGLPTIASGKKGQPHTLLHGETGWIVPPCDEVALAKAIIHLCADPVLRKEMGRKARMEAEDLHGWDRTARQLEQNFLSLLGERAPQGQV